MEERKIHNEWLGKLVNYLTVLKDEAQSEGEDMLIQEIIKCVRENITVFEWPIPESEAELEQI